MVLTAPKNTFGKDRVTQNNPQTLLWAVSCTSRNSFYLPELLSLLLFVGWMCKFLHALTENLHPLCVYIWMYGMKPVLLCHILYVCCGKDFASFVLLCTRCPPLHKYRVTSSPAPSTDPPLFSFSPLWPSETSHNLPRYCYAGDVVTSKGSSPSPRPPGQPWGWPGVEPATLLPSGSILRSERHRQCA